MKILFDQGTPAPLRNALIMHTVATAFELGWSTLRNGELLAAAESASFDVFITTDQSLRYQQNLSQRRVALVILGTTSWPRIREHLPAVVEAVANSLPGGYIEVAIL